MTKTDSDADATLEHARFLPMTAVMRSMWLHEQLDPSGVVNQLSFAFRHHGPLDPDLLNRAISGVVDRHETLRSTVHATDGEPFLFVHESMDVTLDQIQVADWDDGQVGEFVREWSLAPFDLDHGPLCRFALLVLSPDEQIFVLGAHHLISDMWSFSTMGGEIGFTYTRLCDGEDPTLPAPRSTFLDHVESERTFLASEQGATGLEFWRSELADLNEVMVLSPDRSQSNEAGRRGAVFSMGLGASRTKAVRDMATLLGRTQFEVMLAAYASVLSRMTRRDDVAIATVKAGRSARNARVQGCFINPSILRIGIDDSASFSEIVAQVGRTVERVSPHERYPLQEVIEHDTTRTSAVRPYSRVAFLWQKTTKRFDRGASAAAAAGRTGVHGDFGGLELETAFFGNRVAPYDVAMLVAEVDDEYIVSFEYAQAVFDDATIVGLARSVQTFLDAAICDPEELVARLPLLEAEERRRLVEEWAHVSSPAVDGITVTRLIESAMAAHAVKAAVRFGNDAVTYGELDCRADELARRLRRQGVGRGSLVGVHIDRGIDMVVAVVAVLKAGAAFVPLDPDQPADRLQFMIDDADISVVISASALDADEASRSAVVITVDAEPDNENDSVGGSTVEGRGEPVVEEATPDDLAYALYTSGSTGRPKAVAIEHRTLANLFGSMIDRPGIGPDDVVLAQTTLSFDMSMVELLLPLVVGATVVVVDRAVMLDGRALQRVVDDHGVTIVQATPSVYRSVIDEGWRGGDQLKLWSAGEAMTPDLARRLLERGRKVWNSYGPTETINVTFLDVGEEWPGGVAPVPLGSPIAETSLYVLDEAGEPVPLGVVGELCVGGTAVGRGYLNRPELTKERFVADPFQTNDGSRMYRTGDLVRRRRDGSLEFHGRNDDQVKVRGVRVELGEVESILEQHTAVRSAVVSVQGSSDAHVLVAYVVPRPDSEEPLPADLTAFVARALPGPMVPAAVMVLDALPLTANGKVDRRALPEVPVVDADRGGREFEPPRTATERAIAEIWSAVLGRDRIGRNDDFFQLGGHSLLATKIASRIRRRFDRWIDIRDVFDYATVAAQAARVEQSGADGLLTVEVDRAISPSGVYPLTYSQERMWFLHRLDPGGVAYNVSGAVRIEGPLDVSALRHAIEYVVNRHDGLRTVFGEEQGVPVQRVVAAMDVDVPVVDCTGLAISDRWERIIEMMEDEARRPFDLTQPPPCRFAVYRADSDDHGLLVCQHHIVSDQWSLGILASEISKAYTAFRNRTEPKLDEVPLQLGQYAQWHRRMVEENHLDRHLDYWRQQLDSVPVLELPTDRPRPPLKTYSGSTIHVDIDADIMGSIEALCRDARVTPFMVGLAAFQAILARHSGESDVAVGTAIANRNWFEAEQVIGSMVNTVVMRTTIDERRSFRDLVADVYGTALDAFAHQDMPFARLVTELEVERDPSRSPLFQAFFNVQNAPFDAPGLTGLQTTKIDLERRAAQFDLSLSISSIDDTASFEYNTDLFDDERMGRMFDHYWTLLGAALAQPDAPLASLSMLSESERAEQAEWSEGEVLDVDLTVPAHRLIEDTVKKRPDAVAARFEGDEVTFGELNERANRLARDLVERGVGAGQIVGILLDRSVDMLVAMLAVMKSGAAYVPMDPSSPSGRLEAMADDVEMLLLLTTSDMSASIVSVERVDIDSLDLDRHEFHDLDLVVGADDLAYVIYTSGSTGRPKGVMTEHGNLVHYLHGARVRPGMSASDVVLAVTTLSFDPSVHELILPLVVGAQIVIVSRAVSVDGAALHRMLRESGATIMQATPTTWRMMIEDGWTGTPGLSIQCGGEAMTPELAGELCRRADVVWNQYGPTETTLWATFHEVDPMIDVKGATHSVQLGRPLANTSLHVVDEQLRPVATGVRGELCIGGPGVARGYLGRSDLTAAAFVELPGAPEYGRVYRTGDVVTRHRGGRLTFEGRTDHQVKLRGYRIELGEIEATVDRHPDVTKSVVVVHEVAAGDSRLVAYVTGPDGSSTPTAAEVRSFVQGDLPDYMIPTLLVSLEQFPRTPSNKIDRGRLPEPVMGTQRSNEPVDPPRRGLETVVARVWSDVLGIDEIGRNDDFFALGGHSLLAIRVFARLESEVGHNLVLSTLFEAPTIAGLAELIINGRPASPWTSLVPIRTQGPNTPLFYVSPFLVSVLSLSEIANHLPDMQPFYGLQPQGMENDDPIHDTVEEMAAHYISEMRAVQPSGPYLIGGHCAGSWVAFEMARQLQAVGEQVDDLVLVDYGPPGGQPSHRPRLRDVLARIRYYASEGRLLGAIRWPLSVVRDRFVVRRFGSARARRAAEVRARHAAAHGLYRPEPIEGDAVLVRSSESEELSHRDWHLGWAQLMNGTLAIKTVVGTHAGLVDNVHAKALADVISTSIEASKGSSADPV